MAKQAVLLLAHGTPESADQLPEYLRNVTGGRPMPQAAIDEIQRRYALVGHSPLTEITLEQGRMVEAELAASGQSAPVYVAMRNWRPTIPDVLGKMRAEGVTAATVLCLAPQNAHASVGLYRRAVEAAASGLRLDFTGSWAAHPLLIEAFVERLRPAWTRLSAEAGAPVPVLFTAHSVPCSTTEDCAPYAEEAQQTATLVAARVPRIPQWLLAFQSQSISAAPGSKVAWLGPTVEETLDAIAASGVHTLLLQPIGFLSDHVEILYDVDIHFRAYAAERGLRLERPESLNASVTLARAIADLARQGLERLGSR
jgi:protoporphyrin/coproporphyrin ferrochelatase